MTARRGHRVVVAFGPAVGRVSRDRAEVTTCVQVVDPRCTTCHGVGALPTGSLCGPCAVPVRLMARAGQLGEYRTRSPLVATGRALFPLPGCATCHGTGRDGSRPCLPCALVLRPETTERPSTTT